MEPATAEHGKAGILHTARLYRTLSGKLISNCARTDGGLEGWISLIPSSLKICTADMLSTFESHWPAFADLVSRGPSAYPPAFPFLVFPFVTACEFWSLMFLQLWGSFERAFYSVGKQRTVNWGIEWGKRIS
jgi:hypothetical protein